MKRFIMACGGIFFVVWCAACGIASEDPEIVRVEPKETEAFVEFSPSEKIDEYSDLETPQPDEAPSSQVLDASPSEPAFLCPPKETRSCFDGPKESTAVGGCRFGYKVCDKSGNWGPCLDQVLPTLEECNGKDDDCDGDIDESYSKKGLSCILPDKYARCATGKYDCTDGKLTCQQTQTPQVEECNGKDDDCDGSVDEELTISCQTPCGTGVERCVSGSMLACDAPRPALEVCNGKDDNCDGSIDEMYPEKIVGCVLSGQKGRCAVGLAQCSAGKVICTPNYTYQTERCNGIDDDCDGLTDEGCGKGCLVKDTFPALPKAHTFSIRGVVFHPDGKRYFTYDKHQVYVWDIATHKWLDSFDLPITIFNLVFSKDGRFLFAGDHCRKSIKWELSTRQVVHVYTTTDPQKVHGCFPGVALSPDGKNIALSDYNFDSVKTKHWVEFFDTATGKRSQTIQLGLRYHRLNVTFDLSGDYLLVPTTYDIDQRFSTSIVQVSSNPKRSSICLRDAYAWTQDQKMGVAVEYYVNQVTPMEKIVVCDRVNDKILSSWNIGQKWDLKKRHIYVDISEDGRRVLTGSWAQKDNINIWDVATQKAIMTLSYFDTLSIRKIDLSPDGKFFTILKNDKTTSGRVLEIWEVSTKQRVYTSSMSVHGSLFWPAGDAVMIYGDGVELWSLSLRKSTYRLSNKRLSNTPRAKVIAIHPGGTTVAYVLDNQLHIGDLKTSTFSHQLALRGSVHRMDFHPTKPIISLLYKDNIELRDASTGQLLFVLKGPKEIHQGYFHTNGKEFRASSQIQPGIWVWDISTGRLLGKEQPTLPAPFKMSRDGDILLNWVQVWNARTGVIYFSGGRKPSPFDVALSYIHLDPTGTYLTYKEKQGGSFSLPMWALMDISGRVFYKEYPVEKQESLALPPYLPFISGLGAHGQVAVLEHNDFQGVYSLTQKKFLGYTPLLQVDNSSAIATSKDGKTIAARYKFDHFRVWYCQ